MASFNKTFLLGNLTRDPELRVTPKGQSICQFGLAVNRQFKDESGTQRDETTFVDIEAWGKQGELVAKYLTKGSPCFIEGRLKLDTWDDKQSGQKRSKLKIVLEQVQFLGGRGEGRTATEQPAEGESTAEMRARQERQQRAANAPATQHVDEDVPF